MLDWVPEKKKTFEHATAGFKPKFHYANFPMTSVTSLRQTRDVLFSPNFITPTSPKLSWMGKFRGSQHNGIWAKGDVTGLSQTSWGSQHSGIWALQARRLSV